MLIPWIVGLFFLISSIKHIVGKRHESLSEINKIAERQLNKKNSKNEQLHSVDSVKFNPDLQDNAEAEENYRINQA